MVKFLAAFLMFPIFAFADSHMNCEAVDLADEWTYDITLKGETAHIIYEFGDWKGEYKSPIENGKRFAVPSPYEYREDAFLELTNYGWDIKIYNKDGSPSYNYPDEFLCLGE